MIERSLSEGETPGAGSEIPPPFGPHFWSVARRWSWIGALAGFIAIAALFAFLGRWQLERAITPKDDTQTEIPVALDSLVQPQQPGSGAAYWRMVTADVSIVPGDAMVLSGRTNTDSTVGYWVVVHALETGTQASLAVAVGWTADESQADAAAATLNAPGSTDGGQPLGSVTGRYLPTESPEESDFEHGEHSALATTELVNIWHAPATPVYGGYLTLKTPPAAVAGELEAIDSPPPIPQDQVNLLNLFYAAEWVIFAGSAVFIWWRLVRDAELKELGIDPVQVRRMKRAKAIHNP